MYDEKALVIWITDSGGINTIHANNGKNFADSYLGKLMKKQMDGEDCWGFLLKGSEETVWCKNYVQAKGKLEVAAIALMKEEASNGK